MHQYSLDIFIFWLVFNGLKKLNLTIFHWVPFRVDGYIIMQRTDEGVACAYVHWWKEYVCIHKLVVLHLHIHASGPDVRSLGVTISTKHNITPLCVIIVIF